MKMGRVFIPVGNPLTSWFLIVTQSGYNPLSTFSPTGAEMDFLHLSYYVGHHQADLAPSFYAERYSQIPVCSILEVMHNRTKTVATAPLQFQYIICTHHKHCKVWMKIQTRTSSDQILSETSVSIITVSSPYNMIHPIR